MFRARAMHTGKSDRWSSQNARAVAPWVAWLVATSCVSTERDVCLADDADGISGGSIAFDLTVDDDGFSPAILPAQNMTTVKLTLRNAGTKPHSFVIDCMPTPNTDGCPMTSCFPPEAAVPPIESGASGATIFVTPNPEGIYYYHSDVPGDATVPCTAGAPGCGQFQVK